MRNSSLPSSKKSAAEVEDRRLFFLDLNAMGHQCALDVSLTERSFEQRAYKDYVRCSCLA